MFNSGGIPGFGGGGFMRGRRR
jgi:hypothetical protein